MLHPLAVCIFIKMGEMFLMWNATFEFPEKDLTVLYSATLSSNNNRGNRIMGHDATMMMGGQSGGGSIHGLQSPLDYASTQYKKRIENGFLNTNYPMYSYAPGSKQIDGVTSATSKYFASKGLLYTYRDGKRELTQLTFILRTGLMLFARRASQSVI